MHRLLLCPPDHYAIRYEINPWMNRILGADASLAGRQWAQLRDTLVALGCEVQLVEPQRDWPDMVFTANAGVVWEQRVFLSNFRHAERAGEQHWFERWFRDSAYAISRVPAHLATEGEGDALLFGDTWCCGHGFRSDLEAHRTVIEWTGLRMAGIKLVNPRFYHLDTCFCPLDDRSALWYPGAFDEASRAALIGLVPELIAIPDEEAWRFACNAIVLAQDVVLPADCPKTSAALHARGFRPHGIPMSEFIKAGGACKCLVLHLR